MKNEDIVRSHLRAEGRGWSEPALDRILSDRDLYDKRWMESVVYAAELMAERDSLRATLERAWNSGTNRDETAMRIIREALERKA